MRTSISSLFSKDWNPKRYERPVKAILPNFLVSHPNANMPPSTKLAAQTRSS